MKDSSHWTVTLMSKKVERNFVQARVDQKDYI
jgi:hypothetical protein